MTTPEALNALADRVEREEPSRELDCEIAVSVYGGEVLQIPARFTGGVIFALKLPSAAHIGRFSRNPVEPYTTSLDSAVTLVPEGASWNVQMYRGSGDAVVIYEDNEDRPDLDAEASAKTPAAALTAAALRARAADMQARFAPHPSPSGN